ncbi:hypothetical protein PG996_011036 [Apiospora saccharicola]|uniref:Uncharacterized protein n=1 Tax=Apiospora saccharicola TaxID=335842 RepID=A0ABR1UDY0_9PEZI
MASHKDQSPQDGQKVQLSLSLSTSPPHTLSVHDAYPTEPLKLVATVEQVASPFPERAVTILTKYSCLDNSPAGDDAFARLALHSPQLTVADPECPTPEIKLRPTKRVTFIRVGGDPDILKRAEEDHFSLLTVPPVGQGHAEVVWELSPATLLRKMGNQDESVQDKLLRLLRPGDTYRIWPGSMTICWWSFGSLEDEAGDGLDDKKKKKKVARWTLPDGLPLVRAPGVDETEDVAHRLVDLVDHHNVNFLSSRSAVEDEQIPVIKDMRAEGWVFGEPRAGLKMVVRDQGGEAVFTITE